MIKKKHKDSGYMIPIYDTNKKGIEMSFNWLFALIAGGFILFLAIFAATRIINTGELAADTLNAKNFASLLDTQLAGLASGAKSPPLKLSFETRMAFDCFADPLPFGRETVKFSDKTFNKQYSDFGFPVTIKNKYLFSESGLEGKEFYAFSVGYFMPYKIADLIMFSSLKYCFFNTPENIKRDVSLLEIPNIELANSSSSCDGIKVCFSGGKNCEISVSTSGNYVTKENKKMYYEGNLIYGAIFSSPEIYECNVKRLMNKFNELGGVYLNKIKIIDRMNCRSNVGDKLGFMMNVSQSFSSSKELAYFKSLSDEMDSINNDADTGCKLYKNEN